MRHRDRVVTLATLLSLCAADAHTFRPFDGTDAAVVDTGQLEIELGPLQYLREGSAKSLIAPAAVMGTITSPVRASPPLCLSAGSGQWCI
jgi:hypothetical protein